MVGLHYLRYFVGAVVGAVTVALLVYRAPALSVLTEQLRPFFKPDDKGISAEAMTAFLPEGF